MEVKITAEININHYASQTLKNKQSINNKNSPRKLRINEPCIINNNDGHELICYTEKYVRKNKSCNIDSDKSVPKNNCSIRSSAQDKFNEEVKVIPNYDESLKNSEHSLKTVNCKKSNFQFVVLSIFQKCGEEFEVTVKHVQSPSEFYVRFPKWKSTLELELQKKLNSIPFICKNSTLNKSDITAQKVLLNQKMGVCVLYYSICNEAWYRAKVIDCCLQFDDEFVLIFIMDTGETKCVSVQYLQHMPDEIKTYPMFIQRCHLSNICPINENENTTTFKWTRNTTEFVRYWIELSKSIKIEINSNDDFHSYTSLPVTLWVAESKKCLNQLLIEKNLAYLYIKKKEKNVRKNYGCTVKYWNPMKEDFESHNNTYDLNVCDPAAIIYGYVGKDYQRVCQNFTNKGQCYKGASCRKEHVVLNPLGYTTDKEQVYKTAFNSFRVPSIHEIFHIEVTCILKINNFYCILKNQNTGVGEESLSTLSNFMNTSKNICQMRKLLIPPCAGQIVIGQSSKDKSWCRAKVLESEPERNRCTVIFVDYGIKEALPFSRIRAIESQYLHLPFQAFRCVICGVEQNLESSLEDGMQYLKTVMMEQNLRIKVISVLPGDEVCLLVYLYDKMGNDIGEKLISKNYAVRKEALIIHRDSKVLPG